MTTESDVLQWDEENVNDWLSSIGFPDYRGKILEHDISGEVLIYLDFDTLREIGITSAGHRLEILKAIYRLKVDSGIPIEPEHYIPLSEVNEDIFPENTPLGRLMTLINTQNERIRVLEQDVYRMQHATNGIEEPAFAKQPGLNGGSSLQKQPSFKWATYGSKSVKSPTRPMPDDTTALSLQPQDSPRASPQALEHDLAHHASSSLRPPAKQVDHVEINIPTHASRTPSLPAYTPMAESGTLVERSQPSARTQSNGSIPDNKESRSRPNDDRGDNVFQSFKVSLDDPCSKVLPAALKKYRITDDWRMYALFICYGTTERCLSLDEKPLLLFKKLKDSGKNPVFMLRHVRDIRAPITVAQGKQAEKRRNDGPSGSMDATGPMRKIDKVASAPYTRDTRLHQTPSSVLQPITAKSLKANGNYDPYNTDEMDRSRTATEDSAFGAEPMRVTGNGPGHNDAIILWSGVAYAIAIYPYGADYDDEFDVTVGAMFVVLRRSKGWWQVQRDPSGSGTVDERARKAWVPAGCLLETSVPPATAITEATVLASAQPVSPSTQSLASPINNTMSDAPILPSSIISTSYPGVALMDWLPQGDHELDLVKDDMLRVFKRYNHWSYVVKEGGRRGWVPSWLIGKVVNTSANPPTPGTALTNYDGNQEDNTPSASRLGADLSHSMNGSGFVPQPSPMSPAFPR